MKIRDMNHLLKKDVYMEATISENDIIKLTALIAAEKQSTGRGARKDYITGGL